MFSILSCLACLPLLALLLTAFLPNRWANRNGVRLRRRLTHLAAANAVAAFTLLVLSQVSGPFQWTLGPNLPVSLSFFIDGTAALMLSLVASVGWVICRFSIRYLDGESNQGRYFRWSAFTIGAVSLAVVTSNLIVLTAALLLTSFGLHQLLTHYSDRPAARRSAALKFVFSRVGDFCLLVAAFALYREFGTFELPELFAKIAALTETQMMNSVALPVAAWALVLCAALKSAQFPFHTWLPETMEAPTPVSALMHAGIVNAGGYLLIRTAPIVTHTPIALWAIAGLGAFTALLAALVMMSQSSIKRKLAWSTIAQMGFMMLQCGLGAFSAAMLHIVAHSLYKAHAFLASGNVMNERAAMATSPAVMRGSAANLAGFVLSLTTALGLYIGIATLFGMTPETKPGGLVLGLVLSVGIAYWMKRMFSAGFAFVLPAIATSAALVLSYFVSFTVIDSVVSTSLLETPQLFTTSFFMMAVSVSFAVLLLVEGLAGQGIPSKWMSTLYVHSSNGFYIDAFWRNAAKSVSS